MDGLKPCPFCGGKAYTRESVYVLESSYTLNWTIYCGTYDCIASMGGKQYTSKEKAIAAWNNREGYRTVDNAFQSAVSKWAHADAENRTLRELVTDMHTLLQRCCDGTGLSACIMDRCRMSGENGSCDLEKIEDRMRDLGIGVE